MKKIFITSIFLFLSVIPARAGLFVGVLIVEKGLVVLEPSESGQGPGRVKERARVELGDVIRVGQDGDCRLLVYDGTSARLDRGSDYRITREYLLKMLDGGNIAVLPFRLVLGGRSQSSELPPEPSRIATAVARGDASLRRVDRKQWMPISEPCDLFPGDLIRCSKGASVRVGYLNGPRMLLKEGTVAHFLDSQVNVESGGGLVAMPEEKHGSFTFSASMTALYPLGRAAFFHFYEGKDGCLLKVYDGRVKIALKAQGLPSSSRLGAGYETNLTRAGRIERPQVFMEKEDLQVRLDTLFDSFESFRGKGMKMLAVEEEAKEREGSNNTEPEKKPIVKEGDHELEELFQLPRLGERNLSISK